MSRHLSFKPVIMALAAVITLTLAGCAGFSASTAPPFRDPGLSMSSAQAMVVPGQSTRTDVAASLGPATVVAFHSGFEVWAYRAAPAGADSGTTELVILFDPAGVVHKTRVRLPSKTI